MSEPLADKLSRFTPDGSGLDRDALLFAAGEAAGRAGARPSRPWVALALGLALTQAVTLAGLWPRPTAPVPLPAVPVAPVAPPIRPGAAPPESWDEPASGPLARRMLDPDERPSFTAEDDLTPDPAPLRVGLAASPLID